MAKFVRKKNVNDQLVSLKSDYDALIRLAFRTIVSPELSRQDKVQLIRSEYEKVAPDVERNEHFLERITKLKLEIQNKPKKKLTQYFKDVAALFKEGEIINEADYEELLVFEKKEEKITPLKDTIEHEILQPKLIQVHDFPFYYKDSKKKGEEKEQEDVDQEKQKEEQLNEQEISRHLAELVSQEIETEETIKVKVELLTIIDQMIRKIDWSTLDPDLDVTYSIYGSYVNQLSTKASDIDISLNVNLDNISEKNILAFFKQAISNDLKKHATKIVPIIEARVTLLEIEFVKYGVMISFSVNNKLGNINSKMIELYTKLDPRCQMLGLLVKIWANRHGVISAKKQYLSSYAYNLMVISFLQTVKPPVLPSLQQLRANDPNPTKIFVKKYGTQEIYETRIDYEDNLERLEKIMKEKYSKNTMSTVELLRRFFHFYMKRKSVETITLSVRKGDHLKRSLYDENSKYLYSIEDPFDKEHNPGKFVLKTSDQASKILSTMEESYRLLKKKRVLEIFESDE